MTTLVLAIGKLVVAASKIIAVNPPLGLALCAIGAIGVAIHENRNKK